MSEKAWGIWVNRPGEYVGWFGFASGDKFCPMRFSEGEATERANKSGCEARRIPHAEYETPWNEAVWRERTKA